MMVGRKFLMIVVCVVMSFCALGNKNIESLDRQMFVLEGNTGAGKSTLLRIIKANLPVDVILEPVDKWQAVVAGGNLFDLFFKDPKRWAMTFQSYVLVSRLQAILDHQKSSPTDIPQVLERSVYCDCFCFAKNCYESGFMSAIEWQVYSEWFSLLIKNYTQKPSGFIYLRASPQVCFERVQKRARSEEANFNLEFLTTLHKRHEDWLIYKVDLPEYLKEVPVLIVDCDLEFEQDDQRRAQVIKEIANFINATSIKNVGSSGCPQVIA